MRQNIFRNWKGTSLKFAKFPIGIAFSPHITLDKTLSPGAF
jgi:hypothetical protein